MRRDRLCRSLRVKTRSTAEVNRRQYGDLATTASQRPDKHTQKHPHTHVRARRYSNCKISKLLVHHIFFVYIAVFPHLIIDLFVLV